MLCSNKALFTTTGSTVDLARRPLCPNASLRKKTKLLFYLIVTFRVSVSRLRFSEKTHNYPAISGPGIPQSPMYITYIQAHVDGDEQSKITFYFYINSFLTLKISGGLHFCLLRFVMRLNF